MSLCVKEGEWGEEKSAFWIENLARMYMSKFSLDEMDIQDKNLFLGLYIGRTGGRDFPLTWRQGTV